MELLLLVPEVLGGCAKEGRGAEWALPSAVWWWWIPGERKNKQKITLSRPSSAQEQLDTFRIHIPGFPSSH